MRIDPTKPAFHVRGRGICAVLAVLLSMVVGAVPAAEASGARVSATKASAKLTLVASSLDGAAFDFDEYSDGDITVQVTSSTKKPVDIVDTRDLNYYWTLKPFAAPTTPIRIPATGTAIQAVDSLGKFTVLLPPAQPAGSYTLTAGVPGKSGVAAIPYTALRTLAVGNAAFTFTDESPLRAEAGTNHPLKGALKLENGTGLAGRLIDLSITHPSSGITGSDPAADAGFAILATDPSQPTVEVTTSAKGEFTALLKDAAEYGQGTELGDVVSANTAATPTVGNAAATAATLTVDFVSNTTVPTGTTAVFDPLSGGTPGEAFPSQLTITAPDDTFDTDSATPGVQGDSDTDRDPLVGQVYTITLDHGFFTSGQGPQPSVVGTMAGDLENEGTTLTGITDGTGTIPFQVGMARDTGFDDDGKVTATATAVIGGVSHTTTSAWDSTNPFNGQVRVVLSAANIQVFPVDPAVAGDRAYYDVLALDQFGNRAGKFPIDLTYTRDIDNWDYSDDSTISNFTIGSDMWLTSFEPGTINTTATWVDAPTKLYSDTLGASVVATATSQDSASTSFYNVDFDASTFTLTSTATDVVAIGSVVTQTVRVLDQMDNPVRGYDVQFFRYGPSVVDGNVQGTGTTNALGEVRYTFIGTELGLATVTAQVTNRLKIKDLRVNVRFGKATTARIAVGAGGSSADRLTVLVDGVAAGTVVDLYRVVGDQRTLVTTGKLSSAGRVSFLVKDRNGVAYTSYIAKVRSTLTTAPDFTATVRLR